ncbi:carboxymuconolactone decarboxylase family protein [bacterium]|nr:carboxymuconolactone decarboxylase family protein [bacterium]
MEEYSELEFGRLFSLFAAALVIQSTEKAKSFLQEIREQGAEREQVREVILQTYLFDGYPTALEGMILLSEEWEGIPEPKDSYNFDDWETWRKRGLNLYNQIYGDVADRLQERARSVSPELAEWMIVEGYGKVLSRPGLELRIREMVIVAILFCKQRPRQLHSHLRGAIRLGVDRKQLFELLKDLSTELDVFWLDEAQKILKDIKVNKR